jgi:hypothetical protein
MFFTAMATAFLWPTNSSGARPDHRPAYIAAFTSRPGHMIGITRNDTAMAIAV